MVDCVSLTCITPSRAIRMVYLTLIQETATPLKALLVILFCGNFIYTSDAAVLTSYRLT